MRTRALPLLGHTSLAPSVTVPMRPWYAQIHWFCFWGEDGEIEEHVFVCVPVLPWSLLLSIECEGRARGRLRWNQRYQHSVWMWMHCVIYVYVCLCVRFWVSIVSSAAVSPGYQYGNDYSPLGGRVRRAQGSLAAVVLSPDRGNAGIIRTGRVNGLSNTPLSDLPWAQPTRMKDPATFFFLMVSSVISAAEVLQSGVISQG